MVRTTWWPRTLAWPCWRTVAVTSPGAPERRERREYGHVRRGTPCPGFASVSRASCSRPVSPSSPRRPPMRRIPRTATCASEEAPRTTKDDWREDSSNSSPSTFVLVWPARMRRSRATDCRRCRSRSLANSRSGSVVSTGPMSLACERSNPVEGERNDPIQKNSCTRRIGSGFAMGNVRARGVCPGDLGAHNPLRNLRPWRHCDRVHPRLDHDDRGLRAPVESLRRIRSVQSHRLRSAGPGLFVEDGRGPHLSAARPRSGCPSRSART